MHFFIAEHLNISEVSIFLGAQKFLNLTFFSIAIMAQVEQLSLLRMNAKVIDLLVINYIFN